MNDEKPTADDPVAEPVENPGENPGGVIVDDPTEPDGGSPAATPAPARIPADVNPWAFVGTDLCYLIAAIATAPLWLARMAWTGKLRTDWGARLGEGEIVPHVGCPRILIHAVSVGEVNAIRGLVERLARDRMGVEVVVSATTDTGFARAKELFGGRHEVVRTPFDFTSAVRGWFDRISPDLLVLVELELWPNMTRLAAARRIPVVVVNGRLSDRSIARYRRFRRLVRPMFGRTSMVVAQNKTYAERFSELGAPEVIVGGNMKWDSVALVDEVPGARRLAEEFGIPKDVPLVVAGSTEPGEEELLRDALPDGARLVIAPRKPEWFDGVAARLPGCVRRSRREPGGADARHYLLDTIGELREAYALADVVVVGRSFGRLYGSDPIEPASLGKPVVIGPRVADFRDVVEILVRMKAARQVGRVELGATLRELLDNPQLRLEMGFRGRETVRRQQGSTLRTADILLAMFAGHG